MNTLPPSERTEPDSPHVLKAAIDAAVVPPVARGIVASVTANVKRGASMQRPDRRTIYVRVGDREMWQRADALVGESLSGLVADLLRRWVDEQEAKARMRETGMQRVEVIDEGRKKAFTGRELVVDRRYVVYLTEQGRLAVWDVKPGKLYVYDTFPDMLNDDEKYSGDLLALVAGLIQQDYVEELDI